MRKLVFLLGLIIFYFVYNTAQREFGLTLQSMTESSIAFWIWIVLFIFLSLLMKPLIVGAWIWSVSTNPPLKLVDFGFAIRENMRALGSILSYGIFLVLPGFYRYLQLFWVTWIVYLSPDYTLGRLDAIEGSRALWKNQRFRVLGLVSVFDIVIPVTLESFFGVDSFSETLYQDTLLNSVAFSVASMVSCWVLYRVIQNKMRNFPITS